MQSSLGQQNIQMQQQQASQQQYQTPPMQQAPQTQPMQQPAQGQNVQVPNYSGVNIQIFNPSVTPPGATSPVYNVNAPNYSSNPGCYPPGYYTGNWGSNGAGTDNTNNTNYATNTVNNTENNSKKTEKKEIVQLTDDYIRTIENYLNSQDKEIRLMGAKEVMARLDEDHSRKDDKALNALINKMLQDPASSIRLIALSAINSRIATGDQLTYNLLQQLQNSQSGYGQETLEASNALLKMSGQTVEKEFEAKSSKEPDSKKETKYHLK